MRLGKEWPPPPASIYCQFSQSQSQSPFFFLLSSPLLCSHSLSILLSALLNIAMRGGGLWQSMARHLSRPNKSKSSAAAAATGRRYLASEADLKKTVLYDFHVAHGGKMVPFAGWSMPIQYKDSIMDSTTNCRENGSLFDVSHMCGLSLKGKDAIPFLEKLVIADVASLSPGTGSLTVFTNDKGGAIDDSVITKVQDDHLYLVVNAGCRDKDLAHIEEHMKSFKAKGGDVDWHIHDERSLLALQGPLAAPVLQHLMKEDLSKIYFGEFRILDINGASCYLTRTGYTGEDGFEISVPSENAVDLAKALLEKSEGKIRLTGLGARDSLRLEAGLCLYGNDMEQHITPVEAGLTWAIGKRRRAEGGFLGAEVILKQLEEGPKIRRVGLTSSGPPPRSHSEIQDTNGTNIGEVTSGGFSPCLKKNISMGYVKSGLHKAGTTVKLVVRGKSYDGVVTKMPFVPTKYYKPT
ncbi:Aminomethyltransferase, mitochondrial [Linum perenne]